MQVHSLRQPLAIVTGLRVGLAIAVVALVIAASAVWLGQMMRPQPYDTASASAREAAWAECADRVAVGASSSQAACRSWLAEARPDLVAPSRVMDLGVIPQAVAIGLIASLMAGLALAFAPAAARPRREPIADA